MIRSISDIDYRSNSIEWEYSSGGRHWISYSNAFAMHAALNEAWANRKKKQLEERKRKRKEKKEMEREPDNITLGELISEEELAKA